MDNSIIDNNLQKTEPTQPLKGQVFTSQSQCASRTGTPLSVLRFLKKKGAPGFKGSSIYWDILKPYLAENQELVANKTELTYSELRTEEKKVDIRLKKLEEKKRLGDFLDPEEVSQFLLKLRLSFEAIIKGWSSELPIKLVGLSQGEIEAVLLKETNILLTNFSTQVKEKMATCSKK